MRTLIEGWFLSLLQGGPGVLGLVHRVFDVVGVCPFGRH